MANGVDEFHTDDPMIIAVGVDEDKKPLIPFETVLFICYSELCRFGVIKDTGGGIYGQNLDGSLAWFEQFAHKDKGVLDIRYWIIPKEE